MGLSPDDLRKLHGSGGATSAPSATSAAPKPAPNGRPKTYGINRYGGTCVNCGSFVPAEAGLRDKVGEKWVVFHKPGECRPAPGVEPTHLVVDGEALTPSNLDEGNVAQMKAKAAEFGSPAIWDGDYTLITEGGHRTFNVETMAEDSDFAPGETVISYLAGRDNEGDFKGIGFVKGTVERPRVAVWKRVRDAKGFANLNADLTLFLANVNRARVLAEDEEPDLNGLAVGTVLLAKRCIVCHRKLTNPDSIAAGIGPVCAAG